MKIPNISNHVLHLQPWQLYLVILAGWINREQQEVIEPAPAFSPRRAASLPPAGLS